MKAADTVVSDAEKERSGNRAMSSDGWSPDFEPYEQHEDGNTGKNRLRPRPASPA